MNIRRRSSLFSQAPNVTECKRGKASHQEMRNSRLDTRQRCIICTAARSDDSSAYRPTSSPKLCSSYRERRWFRPTSVIAPSAGSTCRASSVAIWEIQLSTASLHTQSRSTRLLRWRNVKHVALLHGCGCNVYSGPELLGITSMSCLVVFWNLSCLTACMMPLPPAKPQRA